MLCMYVVQYDIILHHMHTKSKRRYKIFCIFIQLYNLIYKYTFNGIISSAKFVGICLGHVKCTDNRFPIDFKLNYFKTSFEINWFVILNTRRLT